MADDLRIQKEHILKRLNKKYRMESGRIIRNIPISATQSQNSLKSLADSRTEYIERLQQRIKQLEKTPSDLEDSNESLRRALRTVSIAKPKPQHRLTKISKSTAPSTKPMVEHLPLFDSNQLPEQDKGMRLVPCAHCNRKFRQERIAVHQATCVKVKKERPTFDERKMRLKDTEMEQYIHHRPKEPQKPTKQQGNALVPCPHCFRHFSDSSVKKHIVICQKLTQKPKRQQFYSK
jgi:exonuclease VII small subunit